MKTMIKKVPFKQLLLIKIIFTGILFSSSLEGQDNRVLKEAEDTLHRIALLMIKAETDSVRTSTNKLFLLHLQKVMGVPGSFDYPFDSLKSLGKLKSPDKFFRIYNWNVPHTDGSNTYYCLLQLASLKGKPNRFFSFTDRSDSIIQPEQQVLNTSNWYGSLYYNIIQCPTVVGRARNYTLLGWDGKSTSVTQKVIEILTFDKQGIPKFGGRLFKNYGDGLNERIIFSYSSTARMTLKYDEQMLPSHISSLNDKALEKLEGKKKKIIVFDRLVPMDPQLKNLYQFYIPESDVYDGFIFLDGAWIYITGIDARNKSNPSMKRR